MPVSVVEQQVAAYNARDIDGFLACYAPDVVIENDARQVIMQGHDQLRAEFGPFFAEHPDLRAEISDRMEIGSYVIDEELIHGWQPEPLRAVVVYHVSEGLIDWVQLLKDTEPD